MKVALVHDYLREYGGAERVLEAFHEIFPEAPVYVAYFNRGSMGSQGKRFEGWDIRTSWLQKIPFANHLVSPFRIFAPMMFESFDLSQYDLVISSCNIYFSKAVITKPETLHISYIHTPPRYLWGYTTSYNYKKYWWTRIGGEIINHMLRIYDFETSQRPDILVANSKNVAERIKKFYRRDSVVIYPPVDVKQFSNLASKQVRSEGDSYFLAVGRLVRGKGMDVIVEACSKLGLPLKVVGVGPEMERLKVVSDEGKGLVCRQAGKRVEFLGQVSDVELVKLYAGAKATILASEDEDFGIVPVESMIAGTPVIAPKSGGFLETVVDGKTGILYDLTKHPTAVGKSVSGGAVRVDSLVEVLREFREGKFKAEDLRKQAEKFSKSKFKREILALLDKRV